MEAIVRQAALRTVDHTPSGAVAAGQVVVVGNQPLVATSPIADGVKGALDALGGVYKVVGDAAIAAGKRVFWNDTANKVTETSTGNKPFGVTVTACSGDTATCDVLHVPTAGSQSAVIAPLTDNGGGATADGTIGAISAAAGACAGGSSPTAGNVDTAIATATAQLATTTKDAIKELSTKVNAIISALQTAGLMATS